MGSVGQPAAAAASVGNGGGVPPNAGHTAWWSHQPHSRVLFGRKSPVLTARALAERLGLSPQAALGLINQLVAAGVLKEATGRAAWRAFVVA